MNRILQIKTASVAGPDAPVHAVMMAVAIEDASTAEAYVKIVAEQFKLHRTLAPPTTKMLLITIVGALSASRFAARWAETQANDDVLRAYMTLMIRADAIQGIETGEPLTMSSLLPSSLTR